MERTRIGPRRLMSKQSGPDDRAMLPRRLSTLGRSVQTCGRARDMRPLTPFSPAALGRRGGAAGGELGDPPVRLGHLEPAARFEGI